MVLEHRLNRINCLPTYHHWARTTKTTYARGKHCNTHTACACLEAGIGQHGVTREEGGHAGPRPGRAVPALRPGRAEGSGHQGQQGWQGRQSRAPRAMRVAGEAQRGMKTTKDSRGGRVGHQGQQGRHSWAPRAPRVAGEAQPDTMGTEDSRGGRAGH